MAKANRGSSKAKQEEKNAPSKGKRDYSHITPEKDETGIPFEKPILPGTEPVDQLAKGVSVAGQKSPLKAAQTPQNVETPPSPSDIPQEEQEHTFLFEIERSIGASYQVTVTRSDGEVQTIRFDGDGVRSAERMAQDWANEQQTALANAKAQRDQLKAEKLAQVVPIVTPLATVDLGIPATEIPPEPAPAFLTPPPGLAKVHAPRENQTPLHKDDLIITARTSKQKVHIIPELQEIVLKFLKDEVIDAFAINEEDGLVIVTHPSARKARFWLTDKNKPIMTRC